MHISLILPVVDGYFLAIVDHSRQNTDDMPVRDAVFLAPTIIAADDIIMLTYFQNAVHDILTVVTFIKRHIILFQPPLNRTMISKSLSCLISGIMLSPLFV